MKFEEKEVVEILKTLPIGYYAGRDIEVVFSTTEETSFYSVLEDKITFSLQNIFTALENSDSIELETAVRTVLYHETAHAILTPEHLKVTDIINIFEDERIETLLEDFFMNTNFKGNIKAICNYQGEKPTSLDEAFFFLVRFRQGRKELLEEVERIIYDFSALNRQTNSWWDIELYKDSIKNLYDALKKDYKDNEQAYQNWNLNESNELQGDLTDFKTRQISNGSSLESDKRDFAEQIREMLENSEHSGKGEKIFKCGACSYVDTALIQKIERIFEKFNKRNNSGSAITNYSGVLNPRLCGNSDYRFFERKAIAKGQNKFGSLHLNLFIDVSGSFYPNKEVVNRLLKALEIISKKNSDFTFDVVHCEVGEQLKKGKEIYIEPGGGNRLTFGIVEIYKELQKPNTMNYNIFLFDGDAYPQKQRRITPFKALDFSNCAFISDSDNEEFLAKNTKSKVIITEKYVDELYKNVFEILEKAFR